jgi:hypothetical protein
MCLLSVTNAHVFEKRIAASTGILNQAGRGYNEAGSDEESSAAAAGAIDPNDTFDQIILKFHDNAPDRMRKKPSVAFSATRLGKREPRC